MKIKSLVLGSASVAALALASTSAQAADIVRHHVVVAPVVVKSAPFSWEGPYAGIELGYSSLKYHAKKDSVNKAFADNSAKPSGVIGGLFAGYNIDMGNNVILGVDGNIDMSSIKKEDKVGFYKQGLSGDIRARLGYAMDRLLPYVAGGISFVDMKAGKAPSDNYKIGGQDVKGKVATGWNLGAGVDYALNNNVMLRADYRFSSVEPQHASLVNNAVSYSKADKLDLYSNNFRVGVAYKF